MAAPYNVAPSRTGQACLWALAGVLAFCGFGLWSFGDREPPPEIVLVNRTPRSLYVRFDSGEGTDDAATLPVGIDKPFRPGAWRTPSLGRRYRVRVFLNEFSAKPLGEIDATGVIVSLDSDLRLTIKPAHAPDHVIVAVETH